MYDFFKNKLTKLNLGTRSQLSEYAIHNIQEMNTNLLLVRVCRLTYPAHKNRLTLLGPGELSTKGPTLLGPGELSTRGPTLLGPGELSSRGPTLLGPGELSTRGPTL